MGAGDSTKEGSSNNQQNTYRYAGVLESRPISASSKNLLVVPGIRPLFFLFFSLSLSLSLSLQPLNDL